MYKTLSPAPVGAAGGAAEGRPLLRQELRARSGLVPRPLPAARHRRPGARRRRRLPITGESSPYYMFHPLAADRIAARPARRQADRAAARPGRAGVLGLHATRRPAASRPSRSSGRSSSSRSGSPARQSGCWRRPGVRQLPPHQHHAYLTRGQYVEQLERLEALFGRDRLHVVDSQRVLRPAGAGVRRRARLPRPCRRLGRGVRAAQRPAALADAGLGPGRGWRTSLPSLRRAGGLAGGAAGVAVLSRTERAPRGDPGALVLLRGRVERRREHGRLGAGQVRGRGQPAGRTGSAPRRRRSAVR